MYWFLLRVQGEKERAVAHLLKAHSARPTNRITNEELGTLYLELRKPEEATRYLAAADTESATGLANLGMAAKGQGHYSEAEKYFRAAAADPADPACGASSGAHAPERNDEAIAAYQALETA
jgi:Flp pilus assembly protein TadD